MLQQSKTKGPLGLAGVVGLMTLCFSARFGLLDGQTVFNATLDATPVGHQRKVP